MVGEKKGESVGSKEVVVFCLFVFYDHLTQLFSFLLLNFYFRFRAIAIKQSVFDVALRAFVLC